MDTNEIQNSTPENTPDIHTAQQPVAAVPSPATQQPSQPQPAQQNPPVYAPLTQSQHPGWKNYRPPQDQPAEPAPAAAATSAPAPAPKSPFANSPYVTYHSQQAPQPNTATAYTGPAAPDAAPAVSPAAAGKKRKTGKVLAHIVASLVAIALIIASCAITAQVVNARWQEETDLLKFHFNEKLDVLQKQLDENKPSSGSGPLDTPAEALTAAQIYEQNLASVVAINCVITSGNPGNTTQGTSAGTGFVFTENGYIVTNYHVVENSTSRSVTMSDGTVLDAQVVGFDDTNDIALLKVEATGLRPVTMGVSSDMNVGDQVVAIGNALGELSYSLTVGYISGTDRDVTTDGTVINMLQTDAAINPGNSGGPLFNAKGQVIGITTAKYSGTTSSGASIEGISFAIPIDDVLGMLEDLRDYGFITGAYLGVGVRAVDPSVAAAYGLPMGAHVVQVNVGSCAAKAGILPKDIITSIAGYKVESLNDLSRALRKVEPGQTSTITVWRGGRELILTITFDAKPQAQAASSVPQNGSLEDWDNYFDDKFGN